MIDNLAGQTEIECLPHTQAAVDRLNLSSDATSLLTNFLNSDHIFNLANNISRILSTKPNNLAEFHNFASGYLFENLAYSFIAQNYEGKYITLSPTETFQVYAALYPFRVFQRNDGFLDKGIRGISIPDGLVFQNSRKTFQLKEILEYKAGIAYSNHREQIRNFSTRHLMSTNLIIGNLEQSQNLGNLIYEIKPELQPKAVRIHPNCGFSYAVPQYSTLNLPGKKIEVPIHSRQLHDLTVALLEDCTPPN